jgi:hypothetical protein
MNPSDDRAMKPWLTSHQRDESEGHHVLRALELCGIRAVDEHVSIGRDG